MKLHVAVTVLVLGAIINQANGLCNTCSAKTGLACVSNTQFKVCAEGIPQGPAISCPTGSFCTPDERVCDPSPTAAKSCAKCETCNDKKVFACTKYNAFSLCKGGDAYDATREYICPDGLVCSVDSDAICIDGTVIGIGGTCPADTTAQETTTEVTITTTPSAKYDPDAFCANVGFPGSYEVTADTTCKEFIRCTSVNSVWIGSLYVCPGSNFFNPQIQACGIDKPARCT